MGLRVFEPSSMEELFAFLEERKSSCLFRGQSPDTRKLNSSLARELRGESQKLPRNYIPPEPLATWRISSLHQYHEIILGTFIPAEDVLRPLNGSGDPLFEVVRYVQQNPSQEKIIHPIKEHPLPTIEFSESSDIALFFGTCKSDKDGAVFCLRKSSIHNFLSLKKAMDRMLLFKEATPCLIHPLPKLNDVDDPKPKRQQATYIFQRDLRHPIDHYLPIEKIVIPQKFHPSIKAGLEERGITEDFVYGRTPN